MKLLIVKLGAIGDVIRTTSILKGLKEKYNASIYWVTKEDAVDVLKNNKLIDKIFVFNKDEIKEEIDLVISLEDNEEGCEFVSKLEYKDVIGVYSDNKKISYTPSEWFDMSLVSRFGKERADELKVENKKTYQQLLGEMLDIDISEPILNLTKKKKKISEKFAMENNISKGDLVIGLNTSAGKRWKFKRLDIKKTIILANRLNKEFKAKIILFGGKEEIERNKKIKNGVSFEIIDAGCDNSLLEFAALIGLCSVVITSDSLALNIAIALKRKVVVFFTVTSAAEIDLYGRGKKIVSKIDCVCCYRKECDKKMNCVDMIKVDDIVKGVKEVLE